MARLHLHIHPPADGERSRPGSQEYFISFSHTANPQVYLGRAVHACRLRVANVCTVRCPWTSPTCTWVIHQQNEWREGWSESELPPPQINKASLEALTWGRGSCCFRTTCRVPVACWPRHAKHTNTHMVSYTCKRLLERVLCTCTWTKVSGPLLKHIWMSRMWTESWSHTASWSLSLVSCISIQTQTNKNSPVCYKSGRIWDCKFSNNLWIVNWLTLSIDCRFIY